MYAILIPFFVLCSLFHLLSTLLTNRCHTLKARALGCNPPPTFPRPWYDPLGIRFTRGLITSASQGLLPHFVKECSDLMDQISGRKCRTYEVTLMGSKCIETEDPENIKAILATQFQDFSLGKRIPIVNPVLGKGIFATEGKTWEHSRAMIRPSFARDRVSDLGLQQRHGLNLQRALHVDASGWTTIIDLQPLFFRLSLDSTTEFLFGEGTNSQLVALGGTKETHVTGFNFAEDFDRLQDHIAQRFRLGGLYWMHDSLDFRTRIKRCHGFVDHHVTKILQSTSMSVPEKDTSTTTDGKEPYVFLRDLTGKTRDPRMLRDEVLNLLVAGRDTTATALGWLFFELSRHPAIYAKLRRCLLNDFGSTPDSEKVSLQSLKQCAYLQYCINESLRLHSPVPYNQRTAMSDTTLPKGGGPNGQQPVYMRKGQKVLYSTHVLHRDVSLWGEDADMFRPERWEGRKYGWDYLPFNGGPRICLGQNFAILSIAYCTLQIVQRFDLLENYHADSVVRQTEGVVSFIKTGVNVRLHQANFKA